MPDPLIVKVWLTLRDRFYLSIRLRKNTGDGVMTARKPLDGSVPSRADDRRRNKGLSFAGMTACERVAEFFKRVTARMRTVAAPLAAMASRNGALTWQRRQSAVGLSRTIVVDGEDVNSPHPKVSKMVRSIGLR